MMGAYKSDPEGEIASMDPVVGLSIAANTKESYAQILKSTALVGGATFLNVLIGIVRTKAMAILLGPMGFGLMSLYTSIFDLARSVGGMGINSSGVRQIAEAVGTGDAVQLGRTVVVLRRISVALGVLGGVLLLLLCVPISLITFGERDHAAAVAVLSIAVLLRLISDGQGALLHGMRRLGDMAKSGVLATLCSTVVAVPLIYWLREQGVVLVLVVIAGISMLFSWWYSRRIRVDLPALNRDEVRKEAASLLNLGIVFMTGGLMVLGVGYVIRIMILRTSGIETAGFYQAAWTLGGIYVGFILEAMGADFYPRLTGMIHEHAECNKLINEQSLVSLLLAGPGIIGTLTFSPLAISIFYGSAFHEAVPILRWICLGMTLRVFIWPIGFVLVAKGAKGLFFWTEFVWVVVHLLLAWPFLEMFGGAGAGMAFFGAYVVHGTLTYLIVKKITGFRWSPENRGAAGLFIPSIGIVFLGCILLREEVATMLGVVAFLICGYFSLRMLSRIIPVENLPRAVRKTLSILRLMPKGGS